MMRRLAEPAGSCWPGLGGLVLMLGGIMGPVTTVGDIVAGLVVLGGLEADTGDWKLTEWLAGVILNSEEPGDWCLRPGHASLAYFFFLSKLFSWASEGAYSTFIIACCFCSWSCLFISNWAWICCSLWALLTLELSLGKASTSGAKLSTLMPRFEAADLPSPSLLSSSSSSLELLRRAANSLLGS